MNNNREGFMQNRAAGCKQVRSVGWIDAIDRQERDSGKSLLVRGYAAVFNETADLFWADERIDPKAFDKVLASAPDVRFLASHEGLALARTTNSSLRLWTDDKGLMFEAELNPNTQASRDLYALIERGDVTQMSFGFTIDREERSEDELGRSTYTILEVGELLEVSAVTFPAYEASSVASVDADSGSDEELGDADSYAFDF